MDRKKTYLKWLMVILASPFLLFLVLAILIYIPPVQNFVVHKVADRVSESMGVDFSIERVRLAFPLDLALHHATAVEKGDTLLDARHLRLHVQLLPLITESKANVDGFELYGVKLNTKDYISDTQIRGFAEELSAVSHGIDWKQELVHVDRAKLRGANMVVVLSDTAQKDTTTSASHWNISVDRADIHNSSIRLIMPGDSMRIGATIGQLALRGGHFDTGKNSYEVRSLLVRSSSATYDIPYEKRAEGLDPNHLSISGLSLRVDTLNYNERGVLRAGLSRVTFKEKCGLDVKNLSGGFYMDSTRIQIPAFNITTPHTQLDAGLSLDFKAFQAGKGGSAKLLLNGHVGAADVRTLAHSYVSPSLLRTWPNQPLQIDAEIGGNMQHLNLGKCLLRMPGIARLDVSGWVNHALYTWRSGHMQLDVHTQSLAVVRKLLPKSLTESICIPDGIAAKGTVDFKADNYKVNLQVNHNHGLLEAKAQVNLRNESYRLAAQAKRFPLSSFVKGLPLSPFTGRIRVSGSRFDVLSPHASLVADAQVKALHYETYDLSGIVLQAKLRGQQAHATFHTSNALFTTNGTLDATIGRSHYDVRLVADVPSVNLMKLGMTKDTLEAGTYVELQARTNKAFSAYKLEGSLRRNHFSSPKRSTMAKDITFDFASSRDTTSAHIEAGDLRLALGSKGNVAHLANHSSRFARMLSKQLDRRALDQERLKRELPECHLYVDANQDNPIFNIARFLGYSFSSLHLDLHTNPLDGMKGDARTGSLKVGALLLDTINAHVLQDSAGVQLFGQVKNYKKSNPNPLEVRLKSYVLRSGAGLELSYLDADGEKGVDIGLQAELADDGVRMHLYPQHPVLAYRKFSVNKDNFIFLGKNKAIHADLDLLADDGTGLKIYSEPGDSVNDITVSVNQVNLGELSALLPYMPQISGMLSGDVHVTDDYTHKQLSAMASLDADNFKYEGTSLGQVGIEAIYLPKNMHEHHASAFISSNGNEVLACNGTYLDKNGGQFEGDAQLHDFPLQMLNAFMAGTDVSLKGIAGGRINVKGTVDRPVLNGTLDLDSAHVYSDVYGFDFRTDERAVEITNSRLLFKDYNLYSTGKQPLVLNGVLDMADFSRIAMDFNMKADNFELINTKKKAKSLVFGKVYANYMGTLKGTTDNLSVRGKLEVLDRTDVTYILKDSPLSVDDRLHDLVQFVNFADTTAREEAKPVPEGGFNLTLGISVSDAALFHCNLSDDGQSYVNLEGGGDLTLRMTQSGDMRLTGQFTANSGEMKYALPVIPLKTFQLVQGSSVEFTGDVMNPTLNIAAKERTKAIVTEDDRQRSVAFDVGVKITKPLNDMGLEFTIEAPEDLNIQNQLASMSAEQRGKAAVTMMATGMYMTDESMLSGSGFKASNALNAFLQSEIQNIAGSALKTIDINLGVESGTSTKGTSTTDYSFQFAKRFWGNRISVIIGGKVSTGVDAQNSAESFINNVSVEYRLDQSASRYVKVFYDRDTQDPLEGQLTKTGAGLVLKRKTNRLGELFIFRRNKKPTTKSVTNE